MTMSPYDNLELDCQARGNPTPTIEWLKNGRPLTGRFENKPIIRKEWKLNLPNVISHHDEGDYTCVVRNDHGQIQHTVRVVIVDRNIDKPHMVLSPKNTTVKEGDTAVLRCLATSDIPCQTQWLKHSFVNGSHVDINTGVMFFNTLKTDDNMYVNDTHLVVRKMTVNDSGLYTCYIANRMGSAWASAWITVTSRQTGVDSVYVIDFTSSLLQQSVVVAVAVVVVFIVALVFVLFVIIPKFGRRGTKRRPVVYVSKSDDDNQLFSATTEQPHRPHQYPGTVAVAPAKKSNVKKKFQQLVGQHFLLDSCSIRLCEPIGEGNFGVVYRANFRRRTTVAVKMLKHDSSLTDQDTADFMQEVQLMMSVGSHVNVIRVIGCCFDIHGCLQVVMEYATHGNLRTFLHCHRPDQMSPGTIRHADCSPRTHTGSLMPMLSYMNTSPVRPAATPPSDADVVHNVPLSEARLLSFAVQVAAGLEFLASQKIVHRDVAARNVLVADNYVAKISDFGLTRQVVRSASAASTSSNSSDDQYYYYRKHNTLVGLLPIKWMSPESMSAHVYTTKSDVWSYGVLLWEIFTYGDTPYPSIPLPNLYRALSEGYRMPKPDYAPDSMYDVMLKCWLFEPHRRPTFGQLVSYIRGIAEYDSVIQNANVLKEPSSSSNNSCVGGEVTSPLLRTPHVYYDTSAIVSPNTVTSNDEDDLFNQQTVSRLLFQSTV
jgi:serine/threonine protein kinase